MGQKFLLSQKTEKYKNIKACTRKQTLQFPEKLTFEIVYISAQYTFAEGESPICGHPPIPYSSVTTYCSIGPLSIVDHQ